MFRNAFRPISVSACGRIVAVCSVLFLAGCAGTGGKEAGTAPDIVTREPITRLAFVSRGELLPQISAPAPDSGVSGRQSSQNSDALPGIETASGEVN